MRIHRVIIVIALLLGLSVTAHADVLAMGALYGGTNQNAAVCYIFNAGPGAVSISTNQIIRSDGIILALATDTCGVLAAGGTCTISANIVNNQAHSCRIFTNYSAATLRGVLDIRQGGTVLINSDLR